MRAIAILLALAFAGAAAAQTVNFSGTVQDDQARFYIFDVDFGAVAQSITLDVTAQASSGASGLDISFIDLDELALNGSANGVESDWDVGTGALNVSMTTPMYDGIRQFVLDVQTDSTNGPSPYTGSITVSAGTITQTGSTLQTVNFDGNARRLFDRGVQLYGQTGAAAQINREFRVDFGAVDQSITFYAISLAFGDSAISYYEVDANGDEQLLGTHSGTGLWQDEQNFTTSTRSGIVKFRVKVNVTDPTGALFTWTCTFPGTVTVVGTGSGGGGGGGGSDDGCAAVPASGGAAALVALLPLAAWLRRRRSK